MEKSLIISVFKVGMNYFALEKKYHTLHKTKVPIIFYRVKNNLFHKGKCQLFKAVTSYLIFQTFFLVKTFKLNFKSLFSIVSLRFMFEGLFDREFLAVQ